VLFVKFDADLRPIDMYDQLSLLHHKMSRNRYVGWKDGGVDGSWA
jgi:hypothetical protein